MKTLYLKNTLRQQKWENTPKLMRCSKSSSKRKFYSYKSIIKNKELSQINNLILYLKKVEK